MKVTDITQIKTTSDSLMAFSSVGPCLSSRRLSELSLDQIEEHDEVVPLFHPVTSKSRTSPDVCRTGRCDRFSVSVFVVEFDPSCLLFEDGRIKIINLRGRDRCPGTALPPCGFGYGTPNDPCHSYRCRQSSATTVSLDLAVAKNLVAGRNRRAKVIRRACSNVSCTSRLFARHLAEIAMTANN
eukprot:scaffold5092_cov179-Amphora_coffeaeformis.AAC.16